jgi:PII-like signaling protein
VVKEQFPARMLRVYLNEDDRCQDRSLLDAHCRGMPRHGVGGDFALRGIEGFGAARRSGRKSLIPSTYSFWCQSSSS